jgi:hypothetical protein
MANAILEKFGVVMNSRRQSRVVLFSSVSLILVSRDVIVNLSGRSEIQSSPAESIHRGRSPQALDYTSKSSS